MTAQIAVLVSFTIKSLFYMYEIHIVWNQTPQTDKTFSWPKSGHYKEILLYLFNIGNIFDHWTNHSHVFSFHYSNYCSQEFLRYLYRMYWKCYELCWSLPNLTSPRSCALLSWKMLAMWNISNRTLNLTLGIASS